MTEILPGSFLYRGIDIPPENLNQAKVLQTNNFEKILWVTQDSQTAQTYIPDWGLSALLNINRNLAERPRPDDGIISALMEACGGTMEITQREWPIEKANPHFGTPHNVVNGTFGRPTSWKFNAPGCTWQEIHNHITNLGYDIKPGSAGWVKLEKNQCVAPADSKFLGSLVIYKCLEPLQGQNRQGTGDLLDPDYHHAAEWGQKAQEADFLLIGDYCQTKIWGNVGHKAVALLEQALPKLELIAILPAYHYEWQDRPQTGASPEELHWKSNGAATLNTHKQLAA